MRVPEVVVTWGGPGRRAEVQAPRRAMRGTALAFSAVPFSPHTEDPMADQTRGKAQHLGGKIKEGIGELLGDSGLERQGRLDQMPWRAEQDQARAEEAATDAATRKI